MSGILSTGRHQYDSPAKELDRLKDAIMRNRGDCKHSKIIGAVRDFIRCRGRDGIPWFRMYKFSPACQEQSRLLRQALKKDVVLEGPAMVFLTLVKSRSRKAFEGGTWISRGATTIDNQFIITKLYYTRGKDGPNMPRGQGFTVVEFALKRSPQIAICVLHRKGYVRLTDDLKRDADVRNYSGANQANNMGVQHQLAEINSAPTVNAYGSVNDSEVLHRTNLVSNSETGQCAFDGTSTEQLSNTSLVNSMNAGLQNNNFMNHGYGNAAPAEFATSDYNRLSLFPLPSNNVPNEQYAPDATPMQDYSYNVTPIQTNGPELPSVNHNGQNAMLHEQVFHADQMLLQNSNLNLTLPEQGAHADQTSLQFPIMPNPNSMNGALHPLPESFPPYGLRDPSHHELSEFDEVDTWLWGTSVADILQDFHR